MTSNLLRYACQLVLPGFGEATQQRLQKAKILIVGAGGLGCPAAQYLAATGIGTIGIADYDTVSISNLHRQILFTHDDIGLKKVEITCKRLKQQNPQLNIIPHDTKITSENVMHTIAPYDIVIDCTDNFDTKYLLNDACVLSYKPLVFGAIYQYEGQLGVWNVPNSDGTFTANYRDLFPSVDAAQIPNCAEGGVIPTLAGIIGCMQANEVIKYITQTGTLLAGKVLVFDALTLQSHIINIGAQTKTNITSLTPTEYVPTISIAEFKLSLNNEIYELIDVRTTEERTTFNIGGKHISIIEIETKFILTAHNKPLVLYCASGKRSAEAVKLIKKKFPEAQVFSLEGGMKSWKEQQ